MKLYSTAGLTLFNFLLGILLPVATVHADLLFSQEFAPLDSHAVARQTEFLSFGFNGGDAPTEAFTLQTDGIMESIVFRMSYTVDDHWQLDGLSGSRGISFHMFNQTTNTDVISGLPIQNFYAINGDPWIDVEPLGFHNNRYVYEYTMDFTASSSGALNIQAGDYEIHLGRFYGQDPGNSPPGWEAGWVSGSSGDGTIDLWNLQDDERTSISGNLGFEIHGVGVPEPGTATTLCLVWLCFAGRRRNLVAARRRSRG